MQGEILSQNESSNIDSFEIGMKVIQLNQEIEYNEFDSLLKNLAQYGDIHDYVLQRIEENRRTPIMHEYYPAYLNFICNNMDSIYFKQIIGKIEGNSIKGYIAYPLVKSYLFESNEKTCEFLNTQRLEEKFNQTNSLLFESLIKLKKELKCGTKH